MAKTRHIPRHLPIALAVTSFLGGLMLLVGCTSSSETHAPTPQSVRCQTGQIQRAELPQELAATGNLEAETSFTVSTRMMGWVKKIYVQEGQTVHQGDPLISIDDSDLMAKKAQAKAGIKEANAVLANAEKMAARFQNLFADKSVSRQQLDDVLTGRDRAAAGLEMAKAGLSEVNVHLSYLDIKASADGIVGRKMIEEGDMANPGMPLLIIEQIARMKVVAHVGEKDISNLSLGDEIRVDITSLDGAVYNTVIEKIIPTANPGSRTYDIETSVPNPDGALKSGMFARVILQGPTVTTILAPTASLTRRGQLTGVWTVRDDNSAHLRWIRLGHERGDAFEVLAGLNGGETIVLSSEQPLVEGDKVVK